MGELQPRDTEEKAHQIQTAKNRRIIQREKDRAIIPALSAIADDIERRRDDGSLAKDAKKMKLGAILGQLTRIVAAIKESAPQVLINNAAGAVPDETWLNANSAVRMTDAEREKARRDAKTIDAEVSK